MTKRAALNSYPPTTPTGLGTCCRTLLKLIPELKLLAYPHPRFHPTMHVPSPYDWNEALGQLGTLVAIERPLPDDLFERARTRGVKTVLVVMHEWLNRDCRWFDATDLFLCPNRAAVVKCAQLGILQSKVRPLPFPMDLESLPFQLRTKAERFVFSNGWGGVNDRKGWPTMRAALELMTHDERGRVSVCSQRPVNVPESTGGLLGNVDNHRVLYFGQDVAVVPSYYEGLGLSIMEPMALGLPVLMTDGAPMNEYAWDAYGPHGYTALIPNVGPKEFKVWNHPVKGTMPSAQGIVNTFRAMTRRPESVIRDMSQAGRAYIEKISSPEALAQWREVLGC